MDCYQISGASSGLTFVFKGITTICGVKQITQNGGTGGRGDYNTYYQSVVPYGASGAISFGSYFHIDGNAVTIQIVNGAPETVTSNWTMTVVGYWLQGA